MTIDISDNNPRIEYAIAQGVVETVFAVPFDFFEDSDVSIYVDGTLKALGADYNLTGGNGSTGTATFVQQVIGATGGSIVAVVRHVSLERTTDLTASYSATGIDDQLDRIVAQIADLDDKASRTIQINDYELASGLSLPALDDRKGKTIQFNVTTGALEVGPSGDDLTAIGSVTSEIATLAGISSTLTSLNGYVAEINAVGDNIASVTGVNSAISNVNTVAGGLANVNLVGASIAEVNDVADSLGEVSVIAGKIGNIDTVALATANIATVAGSIAQVDSLASISANITTVAGLSAAIGTVNTNESSISTVSNSIGDVNDVSNRISDVTSVAGDLTDIGAVAAVVSDVSTVAGISSNVSTVAGITGAIATVNTNAADITAAAGASANISSVAGSITSVNTVASNAASINSVNANATNINATASALTNINAVASDLSDINSVAAIAADINSVAAIPADVTSVADIAADVTSVAGIGADVTATAGALTNINAVAAELDTLADIPGSVNAAAASASSAATYASYSELARDQSQAARDTASAHKLAAEAAATSATNTAFALTGFDLDAIAETKGVTAVDVFVYDTSKDSDGGAWRKRTQGTSWYNETLNTATRGSRREFPAVAVIVAESNKVTIYDGDDPDLPMWRVEVYTGLTTKAITTLDGIVAVATTTGLIVSRYVADDLGSTTPDYTTITTPAIINNVVNDVAMTVLPDAPVDPATGLPVPTIAVATDGGLSIVKDDGTVANLAASTGAAGYEVYFVDFDSRGNLIASHSYDVGYEITAIWGFKAEDIRAIENRPADGSNGNINWGFPTRGVCIPFVPGDKESTADWVVSGLSLHGNGNADFSDGSLLSRCKLDFNDNTDGLVAYTTSTYNTGWMNGDIKGAFLSDTDDTDLVGGTDNDRSVNGNDLTVNGTITRTPVATGADLVAYSGFSASNYLEQPYNSDLDFGTGDFCVMIWCENQDNNTERFIYRFDGTNTSDNTGWDFRVRGYDELSFLAGGQNLDVSGVVPTSGWSLYSAVKKDGVLTLYVDGSAAGSTSHTADVSYPNSVFRVGSGFAGASGDAPLALLRISATAPTAEQIAKIYSDEKVLFQENAQATLYGASDAVTALAHDDTTDLLHVGTSAGRSVFQGLRRVSNTTTAVGTAISASNNLIVEE